MSTNAFIGRMDRPIESDLTAVLGPSKAAWDQLLADLTKEHGADGHEWKSYSPKTGWALRVKRKARTVLWLAPSHQSFEVRFILGDKAVRAAKESDFPKRIVEAMKKAPKYPEGTGIRLEVKSPRDIAPLRKLAAIKLAN